MKKLIICLVATLTVTLFGLTGFAIGATEITLIMPSHEADILGYFEKKAVEFERQTGTKINIVSADWDHVADKVLPALAAGSSAYDIVEFDNCWVAQFAQTGWLRPLEAYAGENYIKGILPALLNLFSA
ncbi:extracellular solute-binding protein [Patescibacteria group bacterium]|nr:extracellular solute-binding protein [Patescibacteria group bacterium]